MHVGDSALWEVDVETEEMKILHRFEFHRVAKEIVVDKGLDSRVLKEMFVVDNETVVNIAIVSKVEVCVLKEVVVYLMPGVLNEGDSNVAKGWRELGSNPGPSDLFVSVVASPENACVEGKSHNGGDVGSLDGALGRVFAMVSANVGVVERIAGGLDIHR